MNQPPFLQALAVVAIVAAAFTWPPVVRQYSAA
jgi:hypothetical protein